MYTCKWRKWKCIKREEKKKKAEQTKQTVDAHGLNPIKSTFNGEPFETETVELRWLKMKLGDKLEVRQAVRCLCIPVAEAWNERTETNNDVVAAVLRCGSFPSVANESKKPKLRKVQAVIKGDRGGTIDQRANGNAKEKKKK
ncbi:hypothetical protein T07_14712 [Trichinella nelsoni]|uniref:Uncharacterized protein n=1 Tax=Trichinella nelsoni TaxID=6336 RepID=A0A0V0RG68_9BILA|nr:hypothetical protein T07_14712 [Trichinella nelsoni]